MPDASCATNLRSLRSRLEFKVFNATKDWTGRIHYEVAGVRVETSITLEWMKKINGLLHFQQNGVGAKVLSFTSGPLKFIDSLSFLPMPLAVPTRWRKVMILQWFTVKVMWECEWDSLCLDQIGNPT